MPIALDKPLSWKNGLIAGSDEETMLKNLQGNILKGHGRNFTTNIFFQFGNNIQTSRDLLRKLGKEYITDALTQFEQTEKYKKHQSEKHSCGEKFKDKAFYHIGLSFAGYVALELEVNAPEGDFFRNGMKKEPSIKFISDDTETWETEFKNDIHALLIVAHDDEETKDDLTAQMIVILQNAGCKIVKEQKGKVLRNEFNEGIEHFGYVDGRSQPLLLTEDIAKESASNWDAKFPLETALTLDVAAHDTEELSFGSFLIFRKLEQNVREFKTREQEIADILKLQGEDRELAGAMLVGRFEDGTPVVLSKKDFGKTPVINDFNYNNDMQGVRCPIHAHIRKTNPRGTGGVPEREVLFVRRGIPYEDKARTHPNDLPEVEVNNMTDFQNTIQPLLPTGDVGLLFMGYNNNIEGQFQIMQAFWANNNNFPSQDHTGFPNVIGIDPVIASKSLTPSASSQQLPNKWGNSIAGTTSCPFSGFVAMKGGEYFFSPSLTFLRQ